MRRALVTGDRGFVGQQFTRFLQAHGWQVSGVDISGPDGRDCRELFKTDETRYDLVVHLAAIVGGRKTIEGNPLSVADDLSVDSEMFQWAIRTKQPRVVYYSSSAAYPIALQTGRPRTFLTEDDIDLNDVRSPDLTYGWSKLTGEYLAQFAEAEGVRTHVFRPFSGYGETQALDYPFPSFIERARRREDPFEVWGDGLQVRDFIHISDVVAATMAAVEQDVPGPVNLGWGRATSFIELAEIVSRASGYSPEIRTLTDEPVGVRYRVCDPTKMLSFYRPRVSLEEGVLRSLQA